MQHMCVPRALHGAGLVKQALQMAAPHKAGLHCSEPV